MKVSIVTEGFKNTGYGHITRCLALYQAFNARDISTTMYVNGDNNSSQILRNTYHEIIDWMNDRELLYSKLRTSNIIIVDSYLADKEFYESIFPLTQYPVFIDDNRRLEFPHGIILNGSIYGESMNYPSPKEGSNLLGAKYIPLRNEFWDVPDKTVRLDINSVLITFGGQDIRNLTPRILRSLSRNYPSLKKNVVIGNGFTNIDQINEAKDKNTILHYAPDASMMLQLMLEADAAITAAGQTIYELARIGVPTIAIAVVDNQLNSMAGWFKEDFLIDNINYLNPNLEHKILLSFSNLQKRPVRERLSKLGRQKVDGGGAKRVVQALIDQIAAPFGFYLRRASEKDASLILNLSNDRVVRANSINQNPISWNEHIVWYNDKIRDINTLFLLAFNRNDGFIGQVRFDINDTSASINISIDKEFRGKGFSKSLIFTTSFKLLKEYPEVSTIKAYIRPQNTPSIKAFSKAGYVQAPDELINNEKFLVYIMARQ